jgi:hypothetical protein
MIAIEPRDNQPPEVVVHGEVTVDDRASEILSPDVLSVNDSDTLVVVIVDGPKHGYLEVRDRSGERKCSFLYFFVFRQVLNHCVCGKPTHDKTHTHDWLLLLSCYFFLRGRMDGTKKSTRKEKWCVFPLFTQLTTYDRRG